MLNAFAVALGEGQGVIAQLNTVKALVVASRVLVLGGFDRAAAEHLLDPGGHW
jgi:hypothetical protein